MGYPDYETSGFPWGGVVFAMCTIVLGGLLMAVHVQNVDKDELLDKAETTISRLEEEVVSLETRIEEWKDFKATPAYLEIEIQDSNMPHKVYWATIRGTTGSIGQYELKEAKVRESSEDYKKEIERAGATQEWEEDVDGQKK